MVVKGRFSKNTGKALQTCVETCHHARGVVGRNLKKIDTLFQNIPK